MINYPRWIRARQRQRQWEYTAQPEVNLLSLVTPVYDTPRRFLRAMARSVFAQDYPWFEWIVIDNGSTNPATRRELSELARDPRVRLQRLEPNRGIMRGTHAAVALARGRYVLPVDSDDLLYPDALRVMAAVLQARGYPALAYSDEDKLLPDGRPDYPFLKPDWDPVLFWNCCYVAHLCAIDRKLAAELGAYTDEQARGCHDWDTFWRFNRAGHEPIHVPEVLYSWRMHAGSTATPDAAPKPYTLACQQHVLGEQLRWHGLADRMELRSNPLFRGVGMWHVARRQIDSVPFFVLLLGTNRGRSQQALCVLAECSYPQIEVALVGSALSQQDAQDWNHEPGPPGRHLCVLDAETYLAPAVQEWLRRLPEEAPVALLSDTVVPLSLDWPWEALGMLELHPDAAVVGGRLFDCSGRTESAGECFGVGGLVGAPDWGRCDGDPGYYGLCISQRSVDAVAPDLCVLPAGFLRWALMQPGVSTQLHELGEWFGGLAHRERRRVIYSPHVTAQRVTFEESRPLNTAFMDRFDSEFGERRFDDRYYARYYSRDPAKGYHLVWQPYAGGPSPAIQALAPLAGGV